MTRLKLWFLGCESTWEDSGQEDSVAAGSGRQGCIKNLRPLHVCSPQNPTHLPPQDQARSSPSSRQRWWYLLSWTRSNEFTSPVMSVTHWPKLIRALPQTLLVESEDKRELYRTQVPSGSQGITMKFSAHSIQSNLDLCPLPPGAEDQVTFASGWDLALG